MNQHEDRAASGVLISHTSKHVNVYERPVAAIRANRPVLFFTGLYGGRLPWWLRLAARFHKGAAGFVAFTMRKRLHPDLPGKNVVSTSVVICEGMRFGLGWVHFSDRFHDAATALWLLFNPRASRYSIFHGFQDSCYWSLRVARWRGMTTLLEVMLPPLRAVDCKVPPHYERQAKRTLARSKAAARSLVRQARKADLLIIQSVFSFEVLSEYGLDRNRMRLVELGVDTKYYKPGLETRAEGMTWRLLFVGQIGFRKGFDLLVSALELLPELPVELTAAGFVFDEVGKDCIAHCPRLHFVGKVSDEQLLELYRSHDWLVIPSRSEGGCNVVMEALACGLPCVVAEGARSVISHGEDGWIVPNNDATALADGLRLLYARRGEQDRWRAAARAKALQHDWSCFHAALNRLYSEVSESRTV